MADPLSEKWMDLRLLASIRLVLGVSALLVAVVDPPQTDRWSSNTYAVLIIYTLYGLSVYFLTARRRAITSHSALPWFDLLGSALLVASSTASSRVFYYFFFFAIIVAAFGWGLTAGLRITLTAASLFTIVGALNAPTNRPLDLDRLLLPSIGLLIFGYLISRWGGFKTQMRNRLQLLKDVTIFSNLRFGIDRTIRAILESVREFYGATACVLIIPKTSNGEIYHIYKIGPSTIPSGTSPPEIASNAAGIFLQPQSEYALIYRKRRRTQTTLFDVSTRQIIDASLPAAEKLASVLEAENYISLPVQYRNQALGRLYIIDSPQRFENSELNFLLQLMDHVTPVIENIRLVDNLASDAAEQERRRIGHDIHDSVIQPYLGLQFGLVALHQKLENGNSGISHDVDELLELTNHELAQLRRYVWGLRAGEEKFDVLVPAIQRYAARFSTVTGIQVEVATAGSIKLSDRLAGELFQIVTEGLSNVRRHALCSDARVELSCNEKSVVLQIKNSRPRNGEKPQADTTNSGDNSITFKPQSIAERASVLGGETKVFVDEQNYTVVSVGIPL